MARRGASQHLRQQGRIGAFLKAANRVLIAGKTSGLWRLEGSPLLGNAFIKYGSGLHCAVDRRCSDGVIQQSGRAGRCGISGASDGIYVTDGYNVQLLSSKIDRLFSSYFGEQ